MPREVPRLDPRTGHWPNNAFCIHRARIVRLTAYGAKAAALHLRYVERDGVEKDGSKGVLYGAEGPVQRRTFAEPRLGERRFGEQAGCDLPRRSGSTHDPCARPGRQSLGKLVGARRHLLLANIAQRNQRSMPM